MQFSLFHDYPELRYGLSEKSDGSMNLGGGDIISQNRRRFLAGRKVVSFVGAEITHGINVHTATSTEANKIIPKADGLTTATTNLFLTVTVADCFPVFVYDPKNKAVGLAHAGWRGVKDNIVGQLFQAMQKNFGSQTEDLLCAIGPGIQAHHFEVKEDVAALFKGYSQFITRAQNITISLPNILREAMLAFGVRHDTIELSQECTFCLDRTYFSHRRDKTEPVEAMLAYIGLTQ